MADRGTCACGEPLPDDGVRRSERVGGPEVCSACWLRERGIEVCVTSTPADLAAGILRVETRAVPIETIRIDGILVDGAASDRP